MQISVLVIDMRNDLISTLQIIPDADIIYGISSNLYDQSIETITQEHINSITCRDSKCFKFGHFHKDIIDETNHIISQSITNNVLTLIFNYNGKKRTYIYQHGNMFNNWHTDIKDFQHIIIPFIPDVFDSVNINSPENYGYIKTMIKSRASNNPYFYIESDSLPIFVEFEEKYTEIPTESKEYAADFEEYDNCIKVSKIQINMDNDTWFDKSILGENRFIKCKKCDQEYEIKNNSTLENFQQNKHFECKIDTYCDFTEIYIKN